MCGRFYKDCLVSAWTASQSYNALYIHTCSIALSSLHAEQEARGSITGLAATITEIGYLLLPSRDMVEISLKRRKSPTN